MWQPISGHLSAKDGGWDDERSVHNARLVEDLLEHPGWEPLLESIELYERALNTMLLLGKADENAAEAAKKLGEMKGLRELDPLARGVVAHGAVAAARIREASQPAAEEVA